MVEATRANAAVRSVAKGAAGMEAGSATEAARPTTEAACPGADMVSLTIDGHPASVPHGTTILEAAKSVGISIPTMCYLAKINEIGACRICVVEVEGQDRLSAACNTPVIEGMAVRTSTPRLIEARKSTMDFLLSQHDTSCTTCVRNGNCVLQGLAEDLNMATSALGEDWTRKPWPSDFPLIRDSAKCVRCMRCVQVCAKVQGCDVWDVVDRGQFTDVGVRDDLPIEDAGCTLCGQCVTHCPTGALTARDDTSEILAALANPDVITVVQVAPSVRTSWAEQMGWPKDAASEGRMVAALRALGFDYIFDTDFGADMTIMEEGTEFLDRFLGKSDDPLPLFTSCCPGWVRYAKQHHPEMVGNLSSAKSPQQIFGALLKTHYASRLRPRGQQNVAEDSADSGVGADANSQAGHGGAKVNTQAGHDGAAVAADAAVAAVAADAEGHTPWRVFNVSIMPCVAKKYECAVEEMMRGSEPDVDAVITVRELQRLMRMARIDAGALTDEPFDKPLDEGAGAAVIFGATGGVMEAALRSAYALALGKNPDPDAFSEVRGLVGWKEKDFQLGEHTVRTAVAHGLANADKLINAVRNGDAEYDFIEVMACPGGCVGGGGQPIHEGCELAGERGRVLYGLDKQRATRFSHENPSVQACYKEFLGEPGSHLAHELLHTNQQEWSL